MSLDIVPDTHIVKELMKNRDLLRGVFDAIENKCYNLVLPPLKSEFLPRVGTTFSWVSETFKSMLREKFIEEKGKLPKDDVIERELKKKGDQKVAKTAIKRSKRTGKAIIVSDDPDFISNQKLRSHLKRKNISVKTFNEFLEFLKLK